MSRALDKFISSTLYKPATPATNSHHTAQNEAIVADVAAHPKNETEIKCRISDAVEYELKRRIHPVDLESKGLQALHFVTGYCPELGVITCAELEGWYKEDLKDIARMPLEQVYRIIKDYADHREWYHHSGAGGRRAIAEIFPVEGGWIFVDIGWYGSMLSSHPFHLIDGKLTGAGPWDLGGHLIEEIGPEDENWNSYQQWLRIKEERNAVGRCLRASAIRDAQNDFGVIVIE